MSSVPSISVVTILNIVLTHPRVFVVPYPIQWHASP
jgi:hypothetical protein